MNKISRDILKFLFVVEYLTIPVLTNGPRTDYCFVECQRERNLTHTVCKRLHECGPIKGCIAIESDENFRSHILHQHNEIRNSIANGSEKGPYGNTGAKNMFALSYDIELEYIAACSVNLCAGPHDDWCNDSERFPVGKNQVLGKNVNWTVRAVPEFYKRIVYFTDADEINEYKPVRPDLRYIESFLRLVWAETRFVGCARSRRDTEDGESMLACLYGPAFYIKGRPVYKMAKMPFEIASECETGRNKEYSALCGNINTVPKDISWVNEPLSSVESVYGKYSLQLCFCLFLLTLLEY
ncbi:hypothetical protein WA026_021965 [Henosepilachna vigintioctopunctata]|uniref:SCP domain-containing protein n=1 Tax=Henosepilachna vigintioctopunctata TaxID=420089 RepID=A0AAW1VBL7_9CUCU